MMIISGGPQSIDESGGGKSFGANISAKWLWRLLTNGSPLQCPLQVESAMFGHYHFLLALVLDTLAKQSAYVCVCLQPEIITELRTRASGGVLTPPIGHNGKWQYVDIGVQNIIGYINYRGWDARARSAVAALASIHKGNYCLPPTHAHTTRPGKQRYGRIGR